MKNILTTGLWGVAFTLIGILFFFYLNLQQAYVYVDSQQIVSGYKGMQDARKEFEFKVMELQAKLDTLRMEAQNKITEYESKKNKISARERELMEELIESKHSQFMNYQQIVNEKIQSSDQELTSKMLGKVNDYIKKYGEKKGYNIIMAATQFGNIVYAKKDMDITEEILKGLNDEYGR
jgi:outer membrane protein